MSTGKSKKRKESRIGNRWIGVDLDGTLAQWDGWKGHEHIGAPVPAMLERVKRWVKMDIEVRIFTARASVPEHIEPVEKWLEKNGLAGLRVTNEKDYRMLQLWDDRCVQVVPNTGELIKNAHWVEPAQSVVETATTGPINTTSGNIASANTTSASDGNSRVP